MAQARRRLYNLQAVIGTVPMIIVAVGVYIVGIAFTVYWSFTNSEIFPSNTLVGLDQYRRLWTSDRWLTAVNNIWFFGAMLIVCNMVFGYLLAVFMDQRIRQEDVFRSIFLFPFAMSLIVTGLVWQWALDPNLGIEQTMHSLGSASFHFSPLVDIDTAIYGLVVAGVWQGSGVPGDPSGPSSLRGIDEVWKAARVDGIPTWRTYLFIALPMMRGAFATAFVLQCVGDVRVYDLIIAMTGGGPGISTTMPAVYVIDMITSSQNVAQGMTAATMMFLPVVVVLAVFFLAETDPERGGKPVTAQQATMAGDAVDVSGGSVTPRDRSRSTSRRRGSAFTPSSSCRRSSSSFPLHHGGDIAEGHARNPPRPDFRIAGEPHLSAVGRRLATRLHRSGTALGLSPEFMNSVKNLPCRASSSRSSLPRSTATRFRSGASRVPTPSSRSWSSARSFPIRSSSTP